MIRCTDACIHQQDGECTMQMFSLTGQTISSMQNPSSHCAYFQPKDLMQTSSSGDKTSTDQNLQSYRRF